MQARETAKMFVDGVIAAEREGRQAGTDSAIEWLTKVLEANDRMAARCDALDELQKNTVAR